MDFPRLPVCTKKQPTIFPNTKYIFAAPFKSNKRVRWAPIYTSATSSPSPTPELGDHTEPNLPPGGDAGGAGARHPDPRAVHGRAGVRDDDPPGEDRRHVSGGIRRHGRLVAAHPAGSRLHRRLEGV